MPTTKKPPTTESSQMMAPDQHPRALKRPEMRGSVPAGVGKAPEPACTPTKIKKTGSNGDESKYPDKRGNFHKGLPHDDFGLVNKKAYDSMLKALKARTGFDKITLDLGRKLTNPQAGLAGDLEGPCPRELKMLAAPGVTSIEASTEAVELYWMSLLRDLEFVKWDTSPKIREAIDDLNDQQQYTGPTEGGKITPRTIFRGCSPGDNKGPFLSQFLLHDIGYGSLVINQRQETVLGKIDYLTDYDTWLAVQNGDPGPFPVKKDPKRRYIRNMRDLARYVQVDALYEAYLNACLILLDTGAKLDPGNPYEDGHPDFKTQIGFGTFGGPHILSLVTEVATRALKAQWYQKWNVHRRLRPEAYGGLVHLTLVGRKGTKKDFDLPDAILKSDAVANTLKNSGGKSALLPIAFPEGSPTHPAYGAGHATVAGACVTILKAWFKEDEPLMLMPKVPRADGEDLDPYTGSDKDELTVEGELNKVAANIAIGRNMAGVHWRSDYTESIRLGEEIALCILSNQRFDYNECGWEFSVTRFDGRKVKVDRRGVFDEKGKAVRLTCDPCKARPVCK